MNLLFIIFILLVFLVLWLIHWLLYRALISIFLVITPRTKIIIAAILTFWGLSFILSSIFSHFTNLFIIKAIYIVSAAWVGLLINLLLSTAIYFFCYPFLKITKIYSSFKKTLGILLLATAFLYSIYGIYNASNVRIKNISLNINRLPVSWQNKKIVQISDMHIGIINGVKFAQKIVNLTNQQEPDLVFITGDYFDGMSGDVDGFIEPLKELKAKQGVYFIIGNHESYFGLEKVIKGLQTTQVKLLINQTVDIDGVQIIGASYQGEEFTNSIDDALKLYRPELPAILLYHAPLEVDKIKKSGIDLLLCGHTHKGQIFPFGYITNLIFKNYDYGLHQEDGFNQYTTSGAGTWGPPMRTGNHPEIVLFKINESLNN